MKELIAEKAFNRKDLLSYLVDWINNILAGNEESSNKCRYISNLGSVIKEIEDSDPIDEYLVKFFKEVNDNGEIEYTLTIPLE